MLKNEIGFPLEKVYPIEEEKYIGNYTDSQFYYHKITWGEVFDWFAYNGIFITFKSWITFALRDRVCYTYQISYEAEGPEGRLIRTVESEDASSFNLAAIASIEETVKIAKRYKFLGI